jgi:hypothetical protein
MNDQADEQTQPSGEVSQTQKRHALLVSRMMSGTIVTLGMVVAFEWADSEADRLGLTIGLTLVMLVFSRLFSESVRYHIESGKTVDLLTSFKMFWGLGAILVPCIVPGVFFLLDGWDLLSRPIAYFLSKWGLVLLLFYSGFSSHRLLGQGYVRSTVVALEYTALAGCLALLRVWI